MVAMERTKYPSPTIHSIGFEQVKDQFGNLHIQFQNGEMNLTNRGYYTDVPKQLFNSMLFSRKPGSYVHQHLRTYFPWVKQESAPVVKPEPRRAVEPEPLDDHELQFADF